MILLMASKDSGDEKLIRRLKKGDEKAFREIYIKYHGELYTVALKYLRSKDLADDAVHDIFVKLWDNRSKLEESGSLSGFLFTAVKNHVLNMVNTRKRKLKKKIKFSYEKDQEEGKSEKEVSFSEYQKLYSEAVEKLPDARREVFMLRVEEGLTNQEVADYLDISIHTVKSQYYKASKFIRGYVNEHIAGDAD